MGKSLKINNWQKSPTWAQGIFAVLGLVSTGATHQALAQAVSSSGSGSTFTTPIGATLIPYNAALPSPLWGGALGSSVPGQRGFVRSEPFFIYPFVAAGFGTNSNVRLQSTDPIKSNFFQIAPRLTADIKSGGQVYALTYQASIVRYANSAPDNVIDHELIGQSRNQFSARSDLNAQAFYLSRNEARGSLNRLLNNEPDHFSAFGANGTFGYGALAAQGRFELDLGFTDKKYDNFRVVNSAFDVSTFNIAGRFLYRVAPRVRMLAELRDTEYSYKNNNIDSSERRLLFGASLDAGAAVSGTAKIGVVNKNFKDNGYKDFTAPAMEVALRWLPLTYSTWDFVAQRVPYDSTGSGSATVNTVLGVSWNHNWQSYFSTYASMQLVNSDFRESSRSDRLTNLSFGGYFDVRTWIRFGAQVSSNARSSDVIGADYKRNVLMFTIGATL